MTFTEVRMTITTSANGVLHFLMDEEKAQEVLDTYSHYKETAEPEECKIAFEDSSRVGGALPPDPGGEIQWNGFAGETKIPCAAITDITIADDPLAP